MAKQPVNLAHLEWAIQSRTRNQAASLRLLKLFRDHEADWQTIGYSRAAQELTSVAFSLWRAAFLADRTGRRVEVFAHAREFLEKMIEDNAIIYATDKNSREWTFNYYTRAARASLESLHRSFPDATREYKLSTMKATERWDYCEDLLEAAIAGFETALTAKAVKPSRRAKRQTGPSAKAKRKIVRALTLAARSEETQTPPKLASPRRKPKS